MKALQTWFDLPWMARLGWTFLHFLWQGSLIAGLLAALRAIPRRRPGANANYALACAALAAMILAPLATLLVLSVPGAPAPVRAGSAVPVLLAPPEATPFLPLSLPARLSPWLGAAWIFGVLICLLRLAAAGLVNARLRSTRTRSAPSEWQASLARLASRLGVACPVRLLVSSLVETPAVLGWLRPVILVPVGALAGLPAAHVEAFLAHELAHIRRHDYLVNLLQSLAEALLFYHPAVWWVSRVIRAEREYCCDDLAVTAAAGGVLNYARALAELESARPAHSPAMAASGGSLGDRILRLVDPAHAASRDLPPAAAVWSLAAVLLISAGALAIRASASPAPPPPAPPPPAPPQEAVVDRQSIWPDTVRTGDLVIEVRGLGTLTSETAAEAKLAQQQSVEVAPSQPVQIFFLNHKDPVAGRVAIVRPGVQNGMVTVELVVQPPLPADVHTGDPLDATITIDRLANVVSVSRPIFAKANSEGTLFKIDPDGQHAVRVPVHFGRISVNRIEIKSGLDPGDRVILSDMSAYSRFDRVTLR